MPRRLALLALACLTGCTGCLPSFDVVNGDGDIKTEERSVDDFAEVEYTNGLRGSVTLGDKKPVTLKTDANLLNVIKTAVVDRRLLFQIDAVAINPTAEPVLTAQGPLLEFAGASGGGSIDVTLPEKHPSLRAQAVDGSTVTVREGSIDVLDVFLNGNSIYEGANTPSPDVTVDLREKAKATLEATGKLKGLVRSGCTLVVYGNPTERTLTVEDGATVQYL